MAELQIQHRFSLPPPPFPPLPPSREEDSDPPAPSSPPPSSSREASAPPAPSSPAPPPPPFDPSRMVGIIRRKALVKELAAVYHAECLTHCQELLELQNQIDEPFTDIKLPDEPRKEAMRPSKRLKKSR